MTPMKLHPRATIKKLSRGDTRIGSRSFWNDLIGSVNAFRTMQVVAGDRNDFIIGDEGSAILTVKSGLAPNGFSHFFWAGEYSSAKAYSGGAVVIVSPGNSAEGTVVSGSKTVRAGMYLCIRATTASTTAQYPCWPLPNPVVSNALNFWMLVSLYPNTVLGCVDGSGTSFYLNGTPA